MTSQRGVGKAGIDRAVENHEAEITVCPLRGFAARTIWGKSAIKTEGNSVNDLCDATFPGSRTKLRTCHPDARKALIQGRAFVPSRPIIAIVFMIPSASSRPLITLSLPTAAVDPRRL
jgi:hypothetical protein